MRALADRRMRRAVWREGRRVRVSLKTRFARGFDLFTPEAEVVRDDRKRRGVTRLQDTQQWRASWAR